MIQPPSAPSPSELKVETAFFADDGVVPNNPDLPVVLMAGAVPASSGPDAIISRMERNGWGGCWTYTVFDYHHYHPNAHEALIVASGWADLHLGGPKGQIFRVTAGDALVLPAGVGHRRCDSSPEFSVCGAYPPGQEDYEIVRATPENRRDAVSRIARVSAPGSDPVHGPDGPLMRLWRI